MTMHRSMWSGNDGLQVFYGFESRSSGSQVFRSLDSPLIFQFCNSYTLGPSRADSPASRQFTILNRVDSPTVDDHSTKGKFLFSSLPPHNLSNILHLNFFLKQGVSCFR